MSTSTATFVYDSGTVRAVHDKSQLFDVTAIKLRLSSGALLTEGFNVSEGKAGAVQYEHAAGYCVVFQQDGELQCSTTDAAEHTVSEVRVVCALKDPFDHCMVQGYQSWNLNRSFLPSG